jgi:rod shape-determining protein MreD
MTPLRSNPLLPDFVLIVLVFWILYFPETVNLLTAFLLGLFMDVQSSNLLGINALGYIIAGFLIVFWYRRILSASPIWQLINVFQVVLLVHISIAITMWILVPSFVFSSLDIFLPATFEALLWPLIKSLLANQGPFISRNKP